MNVESPEALSLDDLCTLTALSKRTIRYYMQIGLVDRPEGETRAARYGARHLEMLLKIRRWSEAGLSLERIRDLLAGGDMPVPDKPRQTGSIEVWSHLHVTDGVEVKLNPARAHLSPGQVRQFFKAVLAAYDDIHQGESST